ncbi:MAG: hypothetical protein LBI56_02150 [Puniceicoccales bacterium]|nr:hypothetical protein [Puniceicoccales bacterium]
MLDSKKIDTRHGTIRTNIQKIVEAHATEANRSLIGVKKLWGAVAAYLATSCFDWRGNISIANCNALKSFFESEELSGFPITSEPYCKIPAMEMIRDQVLTVLGKIDHVKPIGNGKNQSLKQVLNDAATMTALASGQKIFDQMAQISNTSQTPSPSSSSSTTSSNIVIKARNKIGRAILQSLFTPHRQIGLPTCNMDAIIVNETLNNPARLARIFRDILTQSSDAKINLASNQQITLQNVSNGFIDVRPNKPEDEYNQTYLLKSDEDAKDIRIDYIEGDNNTDDDGIKNVGLKIPINDLNDALLANLMQNVYGGNDGVYVIDGFIRSRELYFGTKGDEGFLDGGAIKSTDFHDRTFKVEAEKNINIPAYFFDAAAMTQLQSAAKTLRDSGMTVASTIFSQPNPTVDTANQNETV